MGALYSTLFELFAIVLNFVFSQKFLLNVNLMKRVFNLRLPGGLKFPSNMPMYLLALLGCFGYERKSLRHINRVAERRVARELDIAHFLKR